MASSGNVTRVLTGKRLNRRLLFIGLPVILLVSAVLLLWWETNVLAVEMVEIEITALPPELEGLRVALLCDLHGRQISPDSRLVRSVVGADVDFVAVAGDLIDHDAAELDDVLPLLQALMQVAPTYAVSGNHDYNADWPTLARRLQQAGITVLENSYLIAERNGSSYCLAGVADHFSGHADLAGSLPDDWSGPTILLSHSPTLFEPDWPPSYLESGSADWTARRELLQQVDLTLSGHTHGGQIKLPLIGAVTRGTSEIFPKHHVQGLTAEYGGWLYISRGLGTTGIVRARFLSRPELTILTLKGVR